MRILIVSWLYEPHETPRALRWGSLAREFVRQGHTVEVVTSCHSGSPDRESSPGIEVHRVGGGGFEAARRFIKPAAATSVARRSVPAGVRRMAGCAARAAYEATIKRCYWPDKACIWYPIALSHATRLLRSKPFDLLITVSLPFTSHLVGYALHKRFPAIRWLADIGDPFACQEDSAPNNHALFGRLNRVWEQRVLASATVSVVTNQAMRNTYARLYPGSGERIISAPPLLSIGETHRRSCGKETGPKKLLFLGTLYRSIRNPAFLLRVFQRMEQEFGALFELHFMGDPGDCEPELQWAGDRLGKTVFLHGLQPRRTALQALADADFAINIGNQTTYQLPSKLVEYAALGKPILNFTKIAGDSSEEFLADYPSALHLRETAKAIGEADWRRLRHFLFNARQVEPLRLDQWVQQFRAPAVAAIYTRGAAAVSRAA